MAMSWGADLFKYADQVLLDQGMNGTQAGNIGGAVGGVLGGSAKAVGDGIANTVSSILSPVNYAALLLVSTALGVVIEYIKLMSSLFFPLSIALSLFPVLKNSWVLWFKGIFQIWVSSLFLRMLVTISAIVTVSGASVSGELYVVSSVFLSIICAVMAVFSIISSVTGIANNVISNVANFR
jgi:hypothetical protein